jgi:hypothetical protein
MKKQILLTMLLLVMMQLIFTFQTTAQILPGINITYASDSDSLNYYCSAPSTIYFYVYGSAGGYTTGDSAEININFGDGTDTTFMTEIYPSQSYFYGSAQHVYNAPGAYSCQYIATGPDGSTDTLIVYDEVIISNTCGAIAGQVYLDANGNCIFDTGDTPIPYYTITVSNGTQNVAYAWTDSLGYYSVNVPSGYTYTVALDQNYYYGQTFDITCPSSGSYTVSSVPVSNIDFGLICQEGYDLTGYISGWGFRPGFDASIWFDVWNMRCFPVNGQAKLVLDPLLTYVSSSPAPDAIIGDTLIYDFSNILNGYWNYPYFYLTVSTSLNANIGDSVCLQLIIEPILGDSVPGNNIINACYPVQNSWDPNMKEVSPVGKNASGDILANTDMTYTVHFQNTGTAVAYDIILVDTLDSDLNASSLQIVGSSHPMSFNLMSGNIMKFTFNNIMLPDSGSNQQASHGYVIYKVKQNADLPMGTEITNTAGIYFDFNPAVVTNQTLNTISTAAGINDSYKTESLSIFPVPADKILSLNIPSSVDQALLQIRDLEGRVIYKQYVSGGILGINVEKFKPGVYTVMLSSDTKYYSCKAMVIH